MERRRFLRLVRQALEGLPQSFSDMLDNVDVVVEPRPSRADLREAGVGPDETLFGLYQGIPLTQRESYGMVLPDKISIYQEPLEQEFSEDAELIEEIRVTVLHELAHHFGMSDEQLHDMGLVRLRADTKISRFYLGFDSRSWHARFGSRMPTLLTEQSAPVDGGQSKLKGTHSAELAGTLAATALAHLHAPDS